MATKYWRLRLRGERSADEIQSAIGQSGGTLVRVHVEGDETHVYFAGKQSVSEDVARTITEAGGTTEVSEDTVTQLYSEPGQTQGA